MPAAEPPEFRRLALEPGPQERLRLRPSGERPPETRFRLVHEFAPDRFSVAVTSRTMTVSRSGHYEWRDRAHSGFARHEHKK